MLSGAGMAVLMHMFGELSLKVGLVVDKTCAVWVAASCHQTGQDLRLRLERTTKLAAEAYLSLDGIARNGVRRHRTNEAISHHSATGLRGLEGLGDPAGLDREHCLVVSR
jgi:hypothetical protein